MYYHIYFELYTRYIFCTLSSCNRQEVVVCCCTTYWCYFIAKTTTRDTSFECCWLRRFTDPNVKYQVSYIDYTYVRSIQNHRRRPPSPRKMGLRHRVLPTSFQCCGLWVAFVIPVVSLPLIIGIPDSFSQCGTLLRKPPAGPACIASVCSRLSW